MAKKKRKNPKIVPPSGPHRVSFTMAEVKKAFEEVGMPTGHIPGKKSVTLYIADTGWVDQVNVDDSPAGRSLPESVVSYLQMDAVMALKKKGYRIGFSRTGNPRPSPYSWASARNGKWHRTVAEKPSWTRDETTLCGITFRPVNVTWNEEPPTTERFKCKHCLVSDTAPLRGNACRLTNPRGAYHVHDAQDRCATETNRDRAIALCRTLGPGAKVFDNKTGPGGGEPTVIFENRRNNVDDEGGGGSCNCGLHDCRKCNAAFSCCGSCKAGPGTAPWCSNGGCACHFKGTCCERCAGTPYGVDDPNNEDCMSKECECHACPEGAQHFPDVPCRYCGKGEGVARDDNPRSPRHGEFCPFPRWQDGDGRRVKPDVVTCGNCNRSWCDRCDPAPSAMCPWCNGAGGARIVPTPRDDNPRSSLCGSCGHDPHDGDCGVRVGEDGSDVTFLAVDHPRRRGSSECGCVGYQPGRRAGNPAWPICADCKKRYRPPAYYSTETGTLCPRCAGPDLKPDNENDPRRPRSANPAYADDDEGEGLDAPSCEMCGGPGNFLGQLGRLEHFRCRNCGMDFHREA